MQQPQQSTLPALRPARLPAAPRMDSARTIARRLGVSEEAVELCRASDLIDLHIDTFIPPRLWGYDPLVRHSGGPVGRHWFGHLDLYRMADGGLDGAMWSITTNPFRRPRKRWAVFQRNLKRFEALVARSKGHLQFARNITEYEDAKARGAQAVMLAIQGGNALDAAPSGIHSVKKDLVTRVTIVHLTNSSLGATSAPFSYLRGDKGLSQAGRVFIERMNEARVFVDLAHIHERGFWNAVDAHDASQPLIATHTGVDGVRKHWRNLDDAQIKAIADTGGVVGIIFSTAFLSRRGGPVDGRMIVEHMEHVMNVGGEGVASVGSDYDGAISPPRDMASGETYPRLVQHMLDAGWSEDRIRGVLGANYLASFEALRPR
ncbi:MAG: membrane dipeptidase [Deltaproteobacteria bacterium]|nr:membrane dipeptidase [Deltaproteobacteria bacterium]